MTAGRPVGAPVALSARAYAPALAAVTLVSFGLRLILLATYPLREDEAIYSYWALHLWREDPLFLTVWPDKPPLFLWLLAAAFRLFGVSDASGRFLNIFLSTLTVPAVAATARHLWGRPAGLLAGLLICLSPFAISFAPTVYTDPLMVLAGTLSLVLAVRGRSFGAGLWLGAAIMTKQQGLLYAPLILGALWAVGMRESQTSNRVFSRNLAALSLVWRDWLRLGAGLLFVLLPILYWDSLRWAVAPSPWDLSVRNYSALAMAPPALWAGRAMDWLALGWRLPASWTIWALLILTGYAGLRGWRRAPIISSETRTGNRAILLLAFWMILLAGIHIVANVQIWDRYLLPLAPALALLVAGLLTLAPAIISTNTLSPLLLVAVLLLAPVAVMAGQGRLPIGADHGAYSGLQSANDWLLQQNPDGDILYHDVLGWHHRRYLYDEVRSGAVELRWFASAVYLADNAAKTPLPRKFLIQPVWAPVRDLEQHLAMRRLRLLRRLRAGEFTVYEIMAAPRSRCGWCVNLPGLRILPFDTPGAELAATPR